MGPERIGDNRCVRAPPIRRTSYSARPSLTVWHLTLSAAARSFFKVSLLTMKLLLRLIFVVGGIFLTVNLFALDVGALG